MHVARRENMGHAGLKASLLRPDGPLALHAEGLAHIRPAAGKTGCADEELTGEALSALRLDTLLAHFTADTSVLQTIPVNTCSLDRLQRHPYLRYKQAKSIYTLRRQRVHLNGVDDLRMLPELSDSLITRLLPYLSFE